MKQWWPHIKHEARMYVMQWRLRRMFHDCPRCGLPTASEKLWCYTCLEEMGINR